MHEPTPSGERLDPVPSQAGPAEEFLPFALPDVTQAEIDAVVEVLRSRWLTTGPRAKELEARLAAAVGAPHCVVVNSCTAALHLALEAAGVGRGDEVIVPTLTFAATAGVVHHLGATPVLVDVRETDHNVDPAAVERAIGPRTRAIVPVHFAGVPADMDALSALARDHRLALIDDAAHAFPASYRGREVGTLADATCFSFYATKTITTGEGGAVVTAREDWADRMRVMSLHGISRDAWKRYTQAGSWRYEILAPGFKYNLGDLAAALGLVQLARARSMLERRRSIAARYDAAFRGEPALELLAPEPDRTSAHHLYVVKVVRGALDVERDGFLEALRERGIGVSVHFIPLHEHPWYRRNFDYQPGSFPVAHEVYDRSISLPIYSAMSDLEVTRVIDAVLDVLAEHRPRRSGASVGDGAREHLPPARPSGLHAAVTSGDTPGP